MPGKTKISENELYLLARKYFEDMFPRSSSRDSIDELAWYMVFCYTANNLACEFNPDELFKLLFFK